MAGGNNEVRIKLSADTAPIQNDLKLIDQQIQEIGKGAKIDINADYNTPRQNRRGDDNTSAQKELSKSMGKLGGLGEVFKNFRRDFEKALKVSPNKPNTTQLEHKLDTLQGKLDTETKIYKSLLKKSKGVEDKYGEGSTESLKMDRTVQNAAERVERLGDQIESLKQQLERANAGGGGSSSVDIGNLSGGSGGSGSEGGEAGSLGTQLGQLTKQIGIMTVALSAIKGAASYVSEGAKNAHKNEWSAYETYGTTGWFGSNFNLGRKYALNTGSPYGYATGETMDIQGAYISTSGVTTQDNLTADTKALMHSSRAFGLDASQEAGVAGSFIQQGTYGQGNMSKFTNLLATSIKNAGMTGRENEQLSVLESIETMLGRTNTLVSDGQVQATTGLYSMLASGNAGLKGERGASLVESMNSAITNGDNKMDILLGWGTKYTGEEGRWELEKAKARGVSDPENLKNIFETYETVTGKSISSSGGKLALMNQFGITPDQVEELLKHESEIRSGSYSEDFQKQLSEMAGIEYEEDKYNKGIGKSKALTHKEYEAEKEGAQDAAGDKANVVKSPFEKAFSSMPEPMQSAGGMIGGAVEGVAKNPIFQMWALKKGGNLLKNILTKGGGQAAQSAAAEATASAAEATEAVVTAGEAVTSAAEATTATAEAAEATAATAEAATATTGAAETTTAATTAAETVGGSIAGTVAEGTIVAGAAVLFGQELWNQKRNADIDTKRKKDREEKYKKNKEAWEKSGLNPQDYMSGDDSEENFIANFSPSDLVDASHDANLEYTGAEFISGDKVPKQSEKDKKLQKKYEKEMTKSRSWGDAIGDWIWEHPGKWLGFNKETPQSHAVGNDYIPRDNYPALLHKGEAVLDKEDATDWRQGKTKGSSNSPLDVSKVRDVSDILNTTVKRLENVTNLYGEFIEQEADNIEERKRFGLFGATGSDSRKTYGNTNYATSDKSDGGNTYVDSQSKSTSTNKTSLLSKFKSMFGFSSNATGLDRVPYNGYLTELHKDEAVLTAGQANSWRHDKGGTFTLPEDEVASSGVSTINTLRIELSGNIDGMTSDNQDQIVSAVIAQISRGSDLNILDVLKNNTVRSAH